MYVFDASPLVVLATAERLSVLEHVREPALTERVYEEVVEAGLAHGYADARRIERAVEDGLLTVQAVEEDDRFERLADAEGLSAADASVLALAADVEATAVVDEAVGRDIADVEGIDARGTAYLVLSLVRDGALTSDEARQVVDDLVEAGWYCSTDLYRRVQRKIDDLERDG